MMETQITLLTREMLTDYRTFSGKCIESPEDYMIFRRQAIKELGLDIEKEPETVKTEKKPKAPAESKKEKSYGNEDTARRTDFVCQRLLSQLHSISRTIQRSPTKEDDKSRTGTYQ